MEATVQGALIAGAASMIVAAVAHVWTQYKAEAAKLRERKLERYRELLASISDLADRSQDQAVARRRFAAAANTIVLVAPRDVVTAVMDFHEETSFANKHRTQERHDQLLKTLILRMRRSLELPFAKDERDLDFHLIGTHSADIELERRPQEIAP
jgi:hypothetical protein